MPRGSPGRAMPRRRSPSTRRFSRPRPAEAPCRHGGGSTLPGEAVIVAAMKILHVIPSLALETGGPPRACLGMAGAIAARGHQATVFATDHGLAPEAPRGPLTTADGVVVRYFPLQWPRKFATSWPMGE